MSDASSTKSVVCPACGVSGSGRYCADCGTPLRGASCAACGTALVTGATYCHNCGAATSANGRALAGRQGSPPAGGGTSSRSRLLSWAVVVGAFIAVAVLVLVRRTDASSDGAAAPLGAAAAPLGGGGTPGSPPDIGSMSPRERAERLYDRTMIAKEAGKLDSARFFATMALVAYGQLPEQSLDDRYDMGRVAMVAGTVAQARAQADTILASRPTHLLGLLLARDAARAAGDEAAAKAAQAKLIAVAATEQQTALPEYQSHATELAAALAVKAPNAAR